MPKNQTIIASYPSSTRAQTALNALKAAGLNDVHIRRASRFGVSEDPHFNNPISNAETLTGITLFSTNTSNGENQSERVLMGADPSVSGISARGYGQAGGKAFTLIAFVPNSRVDEAVAIIKQHGGEV